MRPPEIIIYRHGRVLETNTARIQSHHITAAVERYNIAPIEDLFPDDTGFDPNLVIASHLTRSIDTAMQLFGRVDIKDRVFREAELPDLVLLPLKLKPKHWFVVARICWLMGAERNCESIALFRNRVRQAAMRLHEFANQHERVAFVGHGVFNRYLARELQSLGYLSLKKLDWSHGRANRFFFSETQQANQPERPR